MVDHVHDPAVRTEAAALFDAGFALESRGQHTEALRAYDDLIRRFGQVPDPRVQVKVAAALNGTSWLVGQQSGDQPRAVVLDDLITRFADHNTGDPDLDGQLAVAMNHKAIVMGRLQGPEQGIALHDELIQRFGTATPYLVRERVAMSIYGKGSQLAGLNRHREALECYQEAARRTGTASEPKMHELTAMALFASGLSLEELKRRKEAIAVYEDVINRYGNSGDEDLLVHVRSAGRRLEALSKRRWFHLFG
ncbi:tetratricopeptide repeat protein [Kitasatospora sp. LaBMicrA B282]|uniref:tetratricopeptide repeat protein n=1 Tax=Kitasatospora sp. LaBMicrA B282 TaxID=3420949 RepID=UPI003D0CB2C7